MSKDIRAATVFGCALMALALVTMNASAQTYKDSNGTIIPGVAVPPFPYTPLTPGQHNLVVSTATGLTIPAGATYAIVQAAGASVKYTTDGTTPTASVGMTLPSGAALALSGASVLANFRAISSAGTLDVEYFK